MNESDHEMDDLHREQDSRGIPLYRAKRTGRNDRYEKPWQRVPSPVILLTLGVYLLFGYLAQVIEDDMPRVILDSEIAKDESNKFSEEAALRYLNELLGTQARVAGTKYHLEKTKDLKELIDSVVEDARIPVKTAWQFASGAFWLQFGTPHVSRYVNVSNIIAVLEGESGFYNNGSIGTSLLVNCHYDSVPYALGASDNGVFCAAMVETLSRLSKRKTKLKHNVIFLFNGAEENPLQGSHAFLKHPWSKNCFGVINLDASGMNGKPALFQVTDTRLLNVYAKVVSRPNAQAVGEFLFSSGAVPSDTDFRIFRDYGRIFGVDIAFTKYGVVYHTPYDNPSLLHKGVVQNAGEMLMNFIVGAAEQTNVEKMKPNTAVYFDYLSLFTITYSRSTAMIVDLLCSILGFSSVAYYLFIVGLAKSSIKELLWSVLGRIGCTAGGLLFAYIFTVVMVLTTVQLRYLTYPWIVVGTSWAPYLVAAIAVSHLFDLWRNQKTTKPRSIRVYQSASATRLIFSLLLFTISWFPSLVSVRYIFSAVIGILSITSILSMSVYKIFKLQGWRHLTLDIILSVPSIFLVCQLSVRLNAFMSPILGRSGASMPDYTLAVINVGLAVLAASCVSGMELLFTRKFLPYVLSVVLLISAVITFLPLSPYQDDGPATQRHYWFHSDIITYDKNGIETNRTSGLIITKHDAYTLDFVIPALEENNIHYKSKLGFSEDCVQYVHCNLPLYRARFDSALKKSLMLYTGPPAPFSPPPSLKLTKRQCSGDNCTLSFTMIGTAHNLISIMPRPGTNLTSWSYSSPATPAFQHNNYHVYLIVHSEATYSREGCEDKFTLVLKVPTQQQNEPILDMALHSHKIFHPEEYTNEYIKILNAMPKYFSISSHLSVRGNYVF